MSRSVASECYIRAMETIGQRELRNDNAEIIRRVEAGESFVVTRRGLPIADLVPHRDSDRAPERFIDSSRLVGLLADAPAWGMDDFKHERLEADSLVDDSDRDPWV
jgi:prevent-host-death family protein